MKPIILIVDDVLANLKLLLGVLEEQKYEVRAAPKGSVALTIARTVLPDLILLDINMPEMDGYEVCRQLKADERTKEIPVIFISALDDVFDKVKAFEVGGVDYITKPFQFPEVLARVQTQLTTQYLRKQLVQINSNLEELVAIRTAELDEANKSLKELNQVYERFVPHEFLGFLQKKSITQVNLGDQIEQEMTILFADIRSFTTISEHMTPQETFEFVNEYLTWCSPVIQQHHGFIDKYIGDAIMALFPPNMADHALSAAIALLQQLAKYNIYREHLGQPTIKVGIGLHTGTLMLGIIGSPERLQSTVIADSVNIAARTEGLTGEYGASLIITEQTLQKLTDPSQYHLRFLDRVQVKGRTEPTAVFEVLVDDGVGFKLQTKEVFEQGTSLYYDKKFAEASVKFNHVLVQNPEDKAARLYLQRCATLMVQGTPPGWTGIRILTNK